MTRKPKVLVAGATGLIGGATLERMAESAGFHTCVDVREMIARSYGACGI